MATVTHARTSAYRRKTLRIADVARLGPGQILPTILLLVVLAVSLYPIIQVFVQSFQSSRPGTAGTWVLEGWRTVFSQVRS